MHLTQFILCFDAIFLSSKRDDRAYGWYLWSIKEDKHWSTIYPQLCYSEVGK